MRPSSLSFLLFYSFIVSVPESVVTFAADLSVPCAATNHAIKRVVFPTAIYRFTTLSDRYIYDSFIQSIYVMYRVTYLWNFKF